MLDSTLSVTNIAEMAMFYSNWPAFMNFQLDEGPIKQCFDSFYLTDSPLSVTNIAEMALFYSNWPAFMNFTLDEWPVSQTGEFKQFLTVSMLQIVL